MEVLDEVTKNTEKFKKKFSATSDAQSVLNYLKKSEGVIFISSEMLIEWKIDINAFAAAMQEYGISYKNSIIVTRQVPRFYGILVCSNIHKINIVEGLYIAAYEESRGKTKH